MKKTINLDTNLKAAGIVEPLHQIAVNNKMILQLKIIAPLIFSI